MVIRRASTHVPPCDPTVDCPVLANIVRNRNAKISKSKRELSQVTCVECGVLWRKARCLVLCLFLKSEWSKEYEKGRGTFSGEACRQKKSVWLASSRRYRQGTVLSMPPGLAQGQIEERM